MKPHLSKKSEEQILQELGEWLISYASNGSLSGLRICLEQQIGDLTDETLINFLKGPSSEKFGQEKGMAEQLVIAIRHYELLVVLLPYHTPEIHDLLVRGLLIHGELQEADDVYEVDPILLGVFLDRFKKSKGQVNKLLENFWKKYGDLISMATIGTSLFFVEGVLVPKFNWDQNDINNFEYQFFEFQKKDQKITLSDSESKKLWIRLLIQFNLIPATKEDVFLSLKKG
jgi:hypothetical protein